MKKRKNRLVAVVSFVLIIGFLATSLASYFVSLTSLRSQIAQKELPLTSDNIYSEIQRDLLRPIFISSLMANDTFLRDWIIDGEKAEAQIIRYLYHIQKKYKTFTSFFVSEKTHIYYHSDGILKNIKEDEPRDRWYFRVREMQSEYEINVDPDMANKDSMTIFINFKVYDYDKQFIGATGVGLTVRAVKDLIRKYQKNYARNIYFIDKKGRMKLQSAVAQNSPEQIQDMEGMSTIADKILSGRNGYFKYKKSGKTIHLNTRYIPEFDWLLLVEQKEETATRPILNALFINLAICAVITLFVLILTSLTISAYQKRIEKMAATDDLTGIFNRKAFDLFGSQVLKEIKRKKLDLSIVLFDIDHFKNVNDQYGHLTGDAVIQHIVKVSQGVIRESDIFCRWGGEEFLVVLKDCNLTDAYRVAEKVRKAIEDTPAVHNGNKIISTISCGVAYYRKKESVDSLLSRADELLYKAKHQGRNRSEKDMESV